MKIFAMRGLLQELSLCSGWSEEVNTLAERNDRIKTRLFSLL